MEHNHTFQCCSGNFSTPPNMSGLLEKCQTNISIHCCSPIQGTMSKKVGKLWDKSVPYFQQESQPCSLDWRKTIHWNVGPAFFQQPWHIWSCLKTVRTIFQCMVVLQSKSHILVHVEILWSKDLRMQQKVYPNPLYPHSKLINIALIFFIIHLHWPPLSYPLFLN